MSQEPDLTFATAAKQGNCNEQILRLAAKKGYLKVYKISPRNTRITQAEFDKFKENGGMPQIKGGSTDA